MILRSSFLWLWVFLLFGLTNIVRAQHDQPSALKKTPEWKITTDKQDIHVGDVITITLTSEIEKDWYMYSNDFKDIGPIVAEIIFTKNNTYELIGKVKPIGAKRKYEEIWPGEISFFTGKGVFQQKVKILSDKPTIKGTLYFQECSEVTGVCMPPFDQTFEAKIIVATQSEESKTIPANSPMVPSQSVDTAFQNEANTPNANSSEMTGDSIQHTLSKTADASNPKESFIGFLLVAFLAGLIALATPCVFPMLPMTVSFFTKRSESRSQGIRRASMFGLSIIGIYASLGLVFAFFGLGPDFGNWLSTHWLPNVLFFIIFIVFAASFLGLFEITLPHQFVNKVDSKSSMGSAAGIFFMAFTLVLVSFSCTGPIVGSLLIEAVGGKFLKPLLGMAAFGAGLALPFTLFALFPSWLNNLPKSGGWLNSVKVVLGFVEVAFAFKFLSTADVVYHWRILDREIYLSIWIVLSFLLGMYFLGKLKFSHDSDMPFVSVPRFGLALVAFAFGVYMIPGLFGAPLKGLSGLLPPMQTQDFILGSEGGGNHAPANPSASTANIKHAEFLHLPHGLTGYFDYKQALEESKKQNKPIFIDFTGHACVNCRKMEEYVWAKPEVLKRLQNDFIIVSLYADERKELPENEWYTSPRDNKLKKTIGEQNQDLQISKYNFSAQPQYVIIDGKENQLSGPRFFDTDEQKFIDFLDAGKNAFTKN